MLQDAPGTSAQASAVRYWTRARMSAAMQAPDGAPVAGTAAQKRAAGKQRLIARQPPAAGAHAPAKKPANAERHLVKKSAPAPEQKPTPKPVPTPVLTPPGPWLTGDTAGNGLRWVHGGAVTSAVGKIFFTLGDADYVCSGTLVDGKRADVVLTAAHCVTGGPGGVGSGQGGTAAWATNWMFVPGLRNGLVPYGEYTARRFFVSPAWTGPQGGSERYDVAFVQVSAATLSGGFGVAQRPAGLPVEFAKSQDAAPPARAYVFGYAAEPPFTGLYPDYCAGPVVASGGSVRTSCAMTAGDSGGPWLARFSPGAGSGPIVAVSTYKVSTNLRVLYGAVLGPQARALYERAVSSAR